MAAASGLRARLSRGLVVQEGHGPLFATLHPRSIKLLLHRKADPNMVRCARLVVLPTAATFPYEGY
jgi:hypothetical protein